MDFLLLFVITEAEVLLYFASMSCVVHLCGWLRPNADAKHHLLKNLGTVARFSPVLALLPALLLSFNPGVPTALENIWSRPIEESVVFLVVMPAFTAMVFYVMTEDDLRRYGKPSQ